MEDKTIVENINPTSQPFSPPPIRRQPPVIPSIPTAVGVKNISIQHAGIGAAAGLAFIGGTAYAIMIHDNQPTDEAALTTDTPSVTVSESTASIPPSPIYTESAPIVETNITSTNIIAPTPIAPYIPVTAQLLPNGIIHSEAPIATTINDDMSFNQAFASARVEVGAGGAFEWKGKVYDTYYNEEWDAMSDDQKVQYNHSVHVDIPEDNQAIVESHEPIADPLSITPPTDRSAASVEENSVEVVDKPIDVVESSLVSIKGDTHINHLLIDKPDADQAEGVIMSASLPNEGAIADAVKDMNLPNDMHAEQIDNNSDGVADAILVTDNQGHIHAILVDENQNGIFEQAILDTDNNLKPDLYIVDANEDGTIDQEKMLQDTSAEFHSHYLHPDAVTLHEEDNNMMNDMPDFDNHTDIVDFTS